MSAPSPQPALPEDISTLRLPIHPSPATPSRWRSLVPLAVLIIVAAGIWAAASRTQEAMWFLPADYVPDPKSSTVTVMVQEPGCDSGAPPSITRPHVDLSATTATIAVRTRARWMLSANCLGEPPTSLTVDLGQPLGDRTLIDAYGDLDDTWNPIEIRDPSLRAPAAAQR
ncbi:hypothetical protein ACUN7V_20445 [Quadrisphaera oryzae]|uniref:hypothetical protein n=1 Tax=Quadrisphaera TaxID=317661 RepID=UPI0016447046|nr:hypothetical protein [Quadrisphaera sp. RL12-1S]MBC3761457.1 hypothetical protein [Quadrisphaera sp. RL12-1S]